MVKVTRRDFLKKAGLAAAGGCGLLLKGCATKTSYDLIIKDGFVIDGQGNPGAVADVGISGDSITAVGKIRASQARTVLQAKGHVVAPGFIDVHNHTAVGLLVNPKAESAIRQGVTTLVSGQCGNSPFPFSDSMFEEVREENKAEYGVDVDWKTVQGFLSRLERGGMALNYSTFVGQGTIRAAAMGYGDRPPTAVELDLMKRLLADSMTGGALGLSTGLEYTPGSFASTKEIISLCVEAARHNGIYATHVRNEDDSVLEALEEAIRIARESGITLQISHLKVGYARNWPKLGAALRKIEEAGGSGLAVFCDRYPYVAWGTGLSTVFPLWSREGTDKDFVRRLLDPTLQERLIAALAEKESAMGSWDKVLISDVSTDRNRWTVGMNVLEASGRAGKSPYQFVRDLLAEENGRVAMVQFAMSEDNLRRILSHPLVGVGSDGSAVAPYGQMRKGKPHPRFYGTFPRVLGKYIREEKLIPLEAMVRKMTSVPARRFGFSRRGLLKVGHFADIVIFDPDKVIDKATWADPHQYPEGIPHVIVNGRPVIENGEHTGALPGNVLRKEGRGGV
jgi:N-acyl-D-amino-acid deacylase